MIKYKFEEFKVTFVDPTITINPIVREINPIDMTITVDVTLTDSVGSKFVVTLNGVKVQNLTYTSETLTERVMEHLQQFVV